jgi:hypothetical protein
MQLDGLAGTVEQLHPDMAFDDLDPPREGRGAQMPALGSLGERSRLGNGQDVLEPFESHVIRQVAS